MWPTEEVPDEEVFRGDSYEVVAWARDQRPLLFRQFGSYQGEWLLLAANEDEYFLYKDYYGSCSGCDSFQAYEPRSKAQAVDFAKDYPSFIEVPRATMRNLASNGKEALARIFPANIREHGEVDVESFAGDAVLCVKLNEGIDVAASDIIAAPNAELKQRALKAFGYERFVAETDMKEIDKDGENSLLRNDDIVFVYVKDTSTPRRYLLRVPPNMKTVKDAIAWTFNMPASQYQPIIET